MTDGVSGSILRVIAKNANVPIQEFVVKNDSGCGSTIGPALASGLGAKAVDIGAV
jgi:aspartyl aminopeptidase